MKETGKLYEDFVLKKRMKEIPVPTDDIDVMKYLRKIKQPICLFGEGAIDRKNRLREKLAKGLAEDVKISEEQQQYVPKYVEGSNLVGEAKAFFIDFSLPRSQMRLKNEIPICQERIEKANQIGHSFSNYELSACDHADKRPLTSISVFGDNFAMGSLSSNISIWSVSEMKELIILKGHTDRITSVSMINGSSIISGSSDQTFRTWSADGDSSSINLGSIVQCVRPHPSGLYSVAGLGNGEMALIDTKRQQTVASMLSNDGLVNTVSCHTDGSLAFAGGVDTVGRLWDLRSCSSIKVLTGHSGRIICSEFDGGFHVITGGGDNSIHVWDLRNLKRSKKILAHNGPVTSIVPWNDTLISSSMDRSIAVWSQLDFRLYKRFDECPSPVVGCVISQESSNIITASKDGSWRFYNVFSE